MGKQDHPVPEDDSAASGTGFGKGFKTVGAGYFNFFHIYLSNVI
jgi:hypothetical protein